MVNTCGVYGCKNRRSRGSDRGYYRLPAVIFRQGETTKCLTAERRKLWLARILPQTSVANLRVCSDHFIKGELQFGNLAKYTRVCAFRKLLVK